MSASSEPIATTDFVLVIAVVAFSYLTSIVILYYLYKYCKRRKQINIRKRYYRLVIAFNILSVILLSIQMPVLHLTDFGVASNPHLPSVKEQAATLVLLDIFCGYSLLAVLYACAWVLLLRLWLIHYSIKWRVANKTVDVLRYINDQSPQNNWYIRNKRKFGNLPNALKLFVIPYVVSCGLAFALYANCRYSAVFEAVNPVILLVPVVTAAIIWWKTPVYRDFFSIVAEMRFSIIGGAVFGSLYALFSILHLTVLGKDSGIENIFARINYLMLVFLLGQLCLFTTAWVLKQSSSTEQRHKPGKRGCCVFRSTALSHLESLMDASQDISLKLFAKFTLSDVLSDRDGFDLFVMHIQSEFSTENILAVIELTQFREYYGKKETAENQQSPTSPRGKDESNMSMSLILANFNATSERAQFEAVETVKIKLPSHVPKSRLIHDDSVGMMEKISHLMRKYIVSGATFELNLSGALRHSVLREYENMVAAESAADMPGACDLFDEVVKSIMRLMNDSYARFQTTDEYKAFVFKNRNGLSPKTPQLLDVMMEQK